MRLRANSNAEVRDQAPGPDETDPIASGNLYFQRGRAVHDGRKDAAPFPFAATGEPSRPGSRFDSFTLRVEDANRDELMHLTGAHGVVARVANTGTGEQEAWDAPTRTTLRSMPGAWDEGYARG